MKKFIFTITCLAFAFILCSCGGKPTLYLLNWGDYMNGDLIVRFEEEHNCKIEQVIVESNEEMYNVIINQSYPIDIVIPSDYMIEKMYKENLLKKIDLSKLSNHKDDMYDEDLTKLINDYNDYILDYAVPYFMGTIGIMYNDRLPEVETAIKANGWDVFFDKSLTPSDVKMGMYNNPRDAIATAQLYLNQSLNTTSNDLLALAENTLKQQRVDFPNVVYAGDNLKVSVAGGKNLDFAMVYSGDFFDQYYIIEEEERDQYINFFVPETTNIFFDAMVIPTTSEQTDLAHEFLNFFLDKDVIVENVEYVGYCPVTKESYEALLADEYWADLISKYPFHPTKGTNTKGEIYHDLGNDVYNKLAEIYQNVTSSK